MSDLSSQLARAEALVDMKRWPEAIAVVRDVLAHHPTSCRALCLMARCQLGFGDPRAAASWAERAVSADPEDEWPHRLRAIAALRVDDKRTARAAAMEAVRLAPDRVEGQVTLVEAELANRNVRAAQAAADRALQLAPTDHRAHNGAGAVALRRRRAKEAEAHFREALALDPENADALHNLAIALERQGNKRAAVHYFAEASKLDPNDSTHRSNAMRAARIGAGGAIAGSVIARVVIGSTADSGGTNEDQPVVTSTVVPFVTGPDGVAVPLTLPPRPAPTESSESAPSPWVVGAVLLVVTVVIAASVWMRRRREERSGHPLASRDLLRQLRRDDHPLSVRWSWFGIRAALALGLLLTVSLSWAGFASIPDDGAVGWLFAIGGAAASIGLVWISRPGLRRTR